MGLRIALLERLIVAGSEHHAALCLAVRTTIPALLLYRRLGFRILLERDFYNLNGVLSHVMVRRCDGPRRLDPDSVPHSMLGPEN